MAEFAQYLDAVAAIDAEIRDKVDPDTIDPTVDADIRRDLHETLYKQTLARRDTVADLVDQDVAFTRGRDDTDDGGGGFWEAIGTGYDPVDDLNTITDRFGLDHITAGGVLYRRIDQILVPEMWGAVQRSVSDTDQAAKLQRMLTLACSQSWSRIAHLFFVPNGEYRIESTLKAYTYVDANNTLCLASDWVMSGVFFVPAASRITAVQFRNPFRKSVASGNTASEVSSNPRIVFGVRKGRTNGDDTPVWATDAGYTFAGTFPLETTAPYTSNEAERALYVDELDCGFEVIGGNLIGGPRVNVDHCGYFAIGVRLKADDTNAESAAVQIPIDVRGSVCNKVGVLLCVKRSGGSKWCNGCDVNFVGGQHLTGELVSGKAQYGILITEIHPSGTPGYPNGNRFTGGVAEGWTRQSVGAGDSAAIVLDRGLGNDFEDFRIEQYQTSALPYLMPNADPSVKENRISYSVFSTARTAPTHNGRCNPVKITRDPNSSVGTVAIDQSFSKVAEFISRLCRYSSSSVIVLPRPWVRIKSTTSPVFSAIAEADGSAGQKWSLSVDQNPSLIADQDHRIGIGLKVSNVQPWNRIRVITSGDSSRPAFLGLTSAGAVISHSPAFLRLHGGSEFTGSGNAFYWGGSAAEIQFSILPGVAALDTLFCHWWKQGAGTAVLNSYQIWAEGVTLTPIDLAGPRVGGVVPLFPTAGYLPAGEEFAVASKGRYRVTTAGYATAGAWASGATGVLRNEYRSNAGKVYKAAAAAAWPATAGASAPVHTSGTVSDGLIDWEYVATASAAVTKQTESRDLVTIFKAIDGAVTNGEYLAGMTPRAGTLQNVRARLGTPPDAATTLSVMLSRVSAAESDLDDLLSDTIDFDDGDAAGTVKNGTPDSAVTIAAGDTFKVEITGDHENAADLVVSAELVTHVET